MKHIELTKGQFAIVDDSDYVILSMYEWYCSYYGYTVRIVDRKSILMHRVIMGVLDKRQVDHKNGNRLDNRRENLRIALPKENQRNMKTPIHNTTGFKGVSFDKRRNKYRANIYVDNKQVFLGYYTNILDAAKAYNEGALKFHKEFARLNTW